MKFFHYEDVIPYIDIALLDKDTIVTNPNYLFKAVILETPPLIVSKKLYESKIIYLHPDSFTEWKNILVFLHKRKAIPVKLIILSSSDLYFDDSVLEELYETFSETEFWIQNYKGTKKDRISMMPIGVFEQFTNELDKKYTFGISYFSSRGEYRKEFIEFLNNHEEMKRYCRGCVPQEEYYKELSKFYFNVCPMGNGFDTHRFWECLMLKTIPIVKSHDFFDNLLNEYPKLPIVQLKSWEDLPKCIDSFTQELYNELWNNADVSVALEDYWVKKLKLILNN